MSSEQNKRMFMSGEEKMFLKQLICEKSDIIECKKTDAVSVSKKKKAWVEIAAEFNANAQYSNRTVEQLKKCWENLKSRRRKEISSEKCSQMTTGGGPYKPPTQDEIDSVLDATLDIELKDTIDSDTIIMLDPPSNTTGEHSYVLDPEENVLEPTNTVIPEVEDVIGDPIPGPSRTRTSSQNTLTPSRLKNQGSYTSRGTAIERELKARLERTTALQAQEEELHLLRVREQQLKIDEQEIRVEIAKEILKQEKIKTEKLLKDN